MHVLCAPDSFKESLDAPAVANAMTEGVRRAGSGHTADACPVADGGEGTVEALITAAAGRLEARTVTGPRHAPVTARFGIIDHPDTSTRTGVVGLADASGLALLAPDERDPMHTTTFGTGELIQHAIRAGCNELIICIGGSATTDGGAGLAQALGARFYDADHQHITRPITGNDLRTLSRVEPPPHHVPPVRIASDVTNPLCGPRGAAAVYGPQKGAAPEAIPLLDDGLARLADLTHGDPDMPGAGAAGGAGYGLVTFLRGRLERGINLVLDAVNFDERCRNADLVLTGEGKLDASSLEGKAAVEVARRAATFGRPAIAIVGRLGDGADRALQTNGGPLHEALSLTDRFGAERSLHEPAACLRDLTAEIIRRMAHGASNTTN